jgi:hypothetical protein
MLLAKVYVAPIESDVSRKELLVLSTTLRRQSTTVLLLFVAAGFVFLLGELLFIGHLEGTQLIAVIAAVLGILVSLLGMVPRTQARRIAIGLFVVLALSGLYGVLEHREERADRPEEISAPLQAATGRVEREALETFAKNPPVLSPLALSGLAALGILTLLIAPPAAEPSAARPVPSGERSFDRAG